METAKVKYPIGIQSFEKLRSEGYAYIDKTGYVWKLVNEGNVYFLGRPRRFGKSLLLSTIEAYFLGKKELFKGLEIESLEKRWLAYPMLRLDLNAEMYDTPESLNSTLSYNLSEWEKIYGSSETESTISQRFKGVIIRAHEQTGLRVVVLIDEYDKPLLNSINNQNLYDTYKTMLKAFYGVLKSSDDHLQFVLLTGVTKFGQVSVFSDLNQLQDISMLQQYSCICGITEKELVDNFQDGIGKLALTNNESYEETLKRLRTQYDGYHFSKDSEGVYNPFSTLSVLKTSEYSDYWFQTGTPTFLMELIKKTDYDIRSLEGAKLRASAFADYRADIGDPLPVIYQSGYLTIKGYDPRTNLYTLGYPNKEVESGFMDFMIPYFTSLLPSRGSFYIGEFMDDLLAGRVDDFLTRLRAFFADIPYQLNNSNERHYQVVFYIVFKLLGQYIHAEEASAEGRADAVVKVPGFVYVFEFKLHDTAEAALQQIDDKGYSIPYTVPDSETKLLKIGVGFSQEKRNIDRWVIG